jgi:hypothetical protein
MLRSGLLVMTAIAAVGLNATAALADNDVLDSTSQEVKMIAPKFDSFAELALGGGSPTLVAFPWSPGTSSTVTYMVRTSDVDLNITGRLDDDMPDGTSLGVSLTPPTGAVSLGNVNLDEHPTTLVSKVSLVEQSFLGVTYTFTTDRPAGSFTRTVTFSLVEGP